LVSICAAPVADSNFQTVRVDMRFAPLVDH
jgi:hypothetical protein